MFIKWINIESIIIYNLNFILTAQNLPVEESLVVVINITLIIGVVLTYPLQIFPVVEIIENNIFAEGIDLDLFRTDAQSNYDPISCY